MLLKDLIKRWLGMAKLEAKIKDLEEQNKFLNMKLDMLMQGKQ